MRLERCPVCSLSGQSALGRLVSLLPGCCCHDGGDEFLVDFESVGEMLCDQRRDRARSQQFPERLVAVADITVAETPDARSDLFRALGRVPR
jgi:hypothetical protein